MVNPKRGELRLTLGKKTFDARVTLDAVMRIETSLGKGLVKIANSLQEADISTMEIVGILTPVIRGGGNDVNEKDVGQAVFEAGLAEGMKCCAEVLASALSAGNTEGNDEAAEL